MEPLLKAGAFRNGTEVDDPKPAERGWPPSKESAVRGRDGVYAKIIPCRASDAMGVAAGPAGCYDFGMALSDEDFERLIAAFSAPPYVQYGRWTFDYEYPGHFVYFHPEFPLRVYFTPEFNKEGEVDVQIHDNQGNCVDVASWPFLTKRPEDLFAIVRQWLDKVTMGQAPVPDGVKEWRPRS